MRPNGLIVILDRPAEDGERRYIFFGGSTVHQVGQVTQVERVPECAVAQRRHYLCSGLTFIEKFKANVALDVAVEGGQG